MADEELYKEAEEWAKDHHYYNGTINGYVAERDAVINAYIDSVKSREKYITELEAQIEKLIDFIISKTECCDVCPITDTCINSEGTCPYAEILAKGEEEVTREWLMQFISKR